MKSDKPDVDQFDTAASFRAKLGRIIRFSAS